MRSFRDVSGRVPAFKGAVLLVLGLTAAGCDTQASRDASDSTVGLFRLMVGSGEDPNALKVDPDAPPPAVAAKCPPVVIREGTETFRAYERGFEGDPAHVIYQGGITKVARECDFDGKNLKMSFGVAGRVITGPKWNNGPINLPIRAAFVRTGGEAVWSQLYESQPVIAPGETVVQFVEVEQNMAHTIPDNDHVNNYVVYVGFDEIGNGRR
ncbi:hypothetical protein [Microbaculum marinum]|uniref:Lipoprotein n=1 Tax=Microbaculum marinum TaxID=1764581 RepID=A0AAW9RPM5_9HYPH